MKPLAVCVATVCLLIVMLQAQSKNAPKNSKAKNDSFTAEFRKSGTRAVSLLDQLSRYGENEHLATRVDDAISDAEVEARNEADSHGVALLRMYRLAVANMQAVAALGEFVVKEQRRMVADIVSTCQTETGAAFRRDGAATNKSACKESLAAYKAYQDTVRAGSSR